ncbi:hypothetical protein [Phenylobacterium sp.]|uniref:hypothetical protein n=1 Tax=Phenylobacterium sp. TaxID=1871053 RepID=UPI0035AFAF59
MPWVLREPDTWRSRTRRRLRHWRYDHEPGITAAAIGGVCCAVVVGALKLTGLLD